jgi:hypothetical protein
VIKLHILLDLRGSIPVLARVSDGLVHDINILDEVIPKSGSIYIPGSRVPRLHAPLSPASMPNDFRDPGQVQHPASQDLLQLGGQVHRVGLSPDHPIHGLLCFPRLSRLWVPGAREISPGVAPTSSPSIQILAPFGRVVTDNRAASGVIWIAMVPLEFGKASIIWITVLYPVRSSLTS